MKIVHNNLGSQGQDPIATILRQCEELLLEIELNLKVDGDVQKNTDSRR